MAAKSFEKPSSEYYILTDKLSKGTGIVEHFSTPNRPGIDFYIDTDKTVYIWNSNDQSIYLYDQAANGYKSLRHFFARGLKDRELVKEYDERGSTEFSQNIAEEPSEYSEPKPVSPWSDILETKEKLKPKNPFENWDANLAQANFKINSRLACINGQVVSAE